MDIFSTTFVATLHQDLLINKNRSPNSLIKAIKQCNENALTVKQQLKKQKLNNQSLNKELILLKKNHSLVLQKLVQAQSKVQQLTLRNKYIEFNMQKKFLSQIKALNKQIKILMKLQNNQKDKICYLLNRNIQIFGQVNLIFNKYEFSHKSQMLNQIINILSHKRQFFDYHQTHPSLQKENSLSLNSEANIQDLRNSSFKQKQQKSKIKKKSKRKSVTEKSILKKVKLLEYDKRSIDDQNKSIANHESRLTLLINGQVFQQTNIQSQQGQGKILNVDHHNQQLIDQQADKCQLKRKNKKHLSLKISAVNSLMNYQRNQNRQLFQLEVEKQDFFARNQTEVLLQVKNLKHFEQQKINRRNSKQSYYLSINDDISESNQKSFLSPYPLGKIMNKQIQGRMRWEYKKFIQKRQQSLKTIYFTKAVQNNLKDSIKQSDESQKQNSQNSYVSFFQSSYNGL